MMHRQRAQSLVEFAFVAIPFFLLIFGVIDIGRAVWNYNTVAYLARDGARRLEVQSDIETYIVDRCHMLTPACFYVPTPPPASPPPAPPSPLPAHTARVDVALCGGPSPAEVKVTYAFKPGVAFLWGGTAVINLVATSRVYVTPGVCPL
jgi:hypothetical protein